MVGMSEQSSDDIERVPPLNLTKEETEYLWEMMKREVGKEEVQYSDDREVVESLHTKVRTVNPATDQDGDRDE